MFGHANRQNMSPVTSGQIMWLDEEINLNFVSRIQKIVTNWWCKVCIHKDGSDLHGIFIICFSLGLLML